MKTERCCKDLDSSTCHTRISAVYGCLSTSTGVFLVFHFGARDPLQRRFVKDTLIITTDFKVIVGGSNEQNMIVLFIDCFKWSSFYMTCLIIQHNIGLIYHIFRNVAPGQEKTHRLHQCIRHILLLLSEIM